MDRRMRRAVALFHHRGVPRDAGSIVQFLSICLVVLAVDIAWRIGDLHDASPHRWRLGCADSAHTAARGAGGSIPVSIIHPDLLRSADPISLGASHGACRGPDSQ